MRQVALLLLPALTTALQLSGFDFSLLPSLAGTPIPSKIPRSALHLSSNSSSSSANGGISTEPLSCFTRDVYFLVLDGVVLTRDSGFNRRLYNNGTHSDVAAVALFLVALGIAATLLLLAGEYLGRFSVFLVALLIFFLLLLGLIGGTTAWSERKPSTNPFVDCVQPLVLSIILSSTCLARTPSHNCVALLLLVARLEE